MLFAVFKHPDWGSRNDGEMAISAGLVVGEKYPVENVSMGQSHTCISIKGYGSHNSVLFEFENDDGSECNIYKDSKYSPYMK